MYQNAFQMIFTTQVNKNGYLLALLEVSSQLKVCGAWEYPKVLRDKDPLTRDNNRKYYHYNINK